MVRIDYFFVVIYNWTKGGIIMFASNFFPDMTIVVVMLKIFFISMITYYVSFKVLNNTNLFRKNLLHITLSNILIGIICGMIRYKINYFLYLMFLILLLSAFYSKITKNKLGYSIIVSIISLSITYIVYLVSIIIGFIPQKIFNINNDYIALCIIILILVILLDIIFHIRRLKDGFMFLINKSNDEYFEVLILNTYVSILFSFIITTNSSYSIRIQLMLAFMIFTIFMIIIVKKTLTMYYKHKLLIQDLNETKEELEITKRDMNKVEQENIKISKVNHSISHQIKSLNNKLEKLSINSEIANELDIKDRIDKILKEYARDKAIVDLTKTGVEVIDDMLECMKKECIENNIDFELQINGNIHYMTNNIISKDELEILLADHIKDAIISIKHTDNINRSILVRLGLVDEFYCLYIYDTGIEFEIDTLINLGTRPITTHEAEGGTGMGFLNTFDTLKKYNASMIIDEIGNPCKDNYTKVIMIKFDDKGVFKIKSYRSEEIKKTGINNNLEII